MYINFQKLRDADLSVREDELGVRISFKNDGNFAYSDALENLSACFNVDKMTIQPHFDKFLNKVEALSIMEVILESQD